MRWDTEVKSAAAHWGKFYGVKVDPVLVHGILERESAHGTNPNYVKHQGVVPEAGGHVAYGPMQVYDDTVTTWLRLGFPGRDLASHPELGIWYGTKYFAWLTKKFEGDPHRAVAAYNAGPGNAVRNAATGRFFNQAYVDAVVSFWNRYRGTAVSVAPLLVAGVAWLLWSRRRAA